MSKSGDDKDLEGLIAEAFPEQVITNWIIIAEVVDKTSRDLQMGTSEGMTTWMGAGMLHCAKEILMAREFSDGDWTESWNEESEEEEEE